MIELKTLYRSPNAIAHHYSLFRVQDRILLTGHSHQAWPDCALKAHELAWHDAAQYVDYKWEHAAAKAEHVRQGFARLLDDRSGDIALGANTHELVIRWLSALPLDERPRLVTTDGEFHTLRRQLARMDEESWIDVEMVPALPVDSLSERLIAALDERTAAVLVSSVFFQNGQIVSGLGELMAACREKGAELLIDTYHSLNVVPFSVKEEKLEDAFITGGGYKYCQLGEGNCFLRFPKDCSMRPIITGWFSEFDTLSGSKADKNVAYGKGPARFAGATYDPTSHYRAAAVFDFFQEQDLSPEVLRDVSQHQIRLLASRFDVLDADPKLITRDRSVPLDRIGGFLTLTSPKAGALCDLLKKREVYTDFRGDQLRFGPAPYLSDTQLNEAMDLLGEILSETRFGNID